MGKKYYAVRKGFNVGIFETWPECQEQITGFSNAEYKSFKILAEANEYLEKDIDASENTFVYGNTTDSKTNPYPPDKSHMVQVYVDGSYKKGIEKYSYGLLFIYPDGELWKDSGFDNDPRAIESNNVAGELLGTMKAVERCIKENIKEVIIFHDYEGIAKWYKKEWKAKTYVSKMYLKFMDECRDKINIHFEWVKGHSNNEYNDIVDKLAKKALDNKKQRKEGDSYLTVDNFDITDIKSIIELIKEEDAFDEELKVFHNENDSISNSWTLFYLKEKVVVNHYNNSGKLVIQGCKKKLFTILQTFILELTDAETLHQAYKDVYHIKVNKELIDDEVHQYLPNKTESLDLSSQFNQTVKQAILNLHITGDIYDYTQFSFPAYRALEGFIMAVLKKHKINNGNDFKRTFEKNTNDNYSLKDRYLVNLGSPKKIQYINKIYNYYAKNRHIIFHWDSYDIKDSTIIYDEKRYRNAIIEIFRLMDEYYLVR